MNVIRASIVLTCLALVALRARAETRLLISFAGKVVGYTIDGPDAAARPPTEVGRFGYPYQITPAGFFMHKDAAGDFITGHVKDPANAVKVPKPADEHLLNWSLSDRGDRVAWSFHRRGEVGRVYVSDVSTGHYQMVLERKALAWRMSFPRPAWSPDGTRLACYYMMTEGIEEDEMKTVALLGVDLSPKTGPVVTEISPRPFSRDEVLAAPPSLRWSPDGKRLMFRECAAGKARWGVDSRARVIGVDGQGLRDAPGERFLDDHRHVITDQTVEADDARKTLRFRGKVTDTRADKSRAFDETIPLPNFGYNWSPDGRYLAYGRLDPPLKPGDGNSGGTVVVDTQTGATRTIATDKYGIDSTRVHWVQY